MTPQFHDGHAKGPRWCLGMQRVALQERISELGRIITFIISGKKKKNFSYPGGDGTLSLKDSCCKHSPRESAREKRALSSWPLQQDHLGVLRVHCGPSLPKAWYSLLDLFVPHFSCLKLGKEWYLHHRDIVRVERLTECPALRPTPCPEEVVSQNLLSVLINLQPSPFPLSTWFIYGFISPRGRYLLTHFPCSLV